MLFQGPGILWALVLGGLSYVAKSCRVSIHLASPMYSRDAHHQKFDCFAVRQTGEKYLVRWRDRRVYRCTLPHTHRTHLHSAATSFASSTTAAILSTGNPIPRSQKPESLFIIKRSTTAVRNNNSQSIPCIRSQPQHSLSPCHRQHSPPPRQRRNPLCRRSGDRQYRSYTITRTTPVGHTRIWKSVNSGCGRRHST